MHKTLAAVMLILAVMGSSNACVQQGEGSLGIGIGRIGRDSIASTPAANDNRLALRVVR